MSDESNPELSATGAELIALFSSGRHGETSERLQAILPDHPLWGFGWKLQGVCQLLLGRPNDAVAALNRAAGLIPSDSDVPFNLGHALMQTGDLQAAITAFRAAVDLAPERAECHNDLGNLQLALGDNNAALASFREALRLRPDFPEALNNLGNAFKTMGATDAATEAYSRVAALLPGVAEVHCNLGSALQDKGDMAAALAAFRRALELRPDFAYAEGQLPYLMLHCAEWGEVPHAIDLVRQRVRAGRAEDLPSFNFLALPETTRAEQRACARQEVEHDFARLLSRPPLFTAAEKREGDRIRIGYLSSDFHAHATSWLLAGVLEKHDQGRFEIHAYSYGPDDGSPTRRRIVAAVEHFHDVAALSHEDIARRIAADGIDILIDLKGFTQRSRPEILALRPAPIQVNWLGYPGTLGHERLADYLIGDPVVTPLDHAADYSETLALMPHCYQPNDDRRIIGKRPTRAEAGLPETGFVFCSFNQSYKITPEVFDVWCRILRAVPGSVLWLLEPPAPVARENLRREAAARGVDETRLVFAPPMEQAAHLGRLQLADLALDTFPYTSHTTGSDSLWCGVPLITRIGETFASRVAASLLRAAGMGRLVCETWLGYEALAIELAQYPDPLATVKQHLAAARNRCPLFDTAGFAHDIEALYTRMWRDHSDGTLHAIVPEPVERTVSCSHHHSLKGTWQMKEFPPDPEIERGDTLRDAGALDDAMAVYLNITAERPDYPQGHFKLGTAYEQLEKLDLAEASYRKALSLAADYGQAANNLALIMIKRGDNADGETLLRQALAESIDFFDGHLNLANLLARTARPTEALYYYQRALALQPDSIVAKQQYAPMLIEYARLNEAMDLLTEVLDIAPRPAVCWTNLGRIHLMRGNIEGAESCSRKATEIEPSLLASWSNMLMATNFGNKSPEEVFRIHRSFGEHFEAATNETPPQPHANPPNPEKKIRVGFVSSDLRRHSVGYFVEGPLAHLDREKFEAWAYYNFPSEDYRSAVIKPLFHRWRNIMGMGAADVATLIRNDRIDILFDLSGHTGGNRLDVFLLKPAPIQVAWIGYPNTTGLRAMDYRIVDAITDPPGESDRYHTETLVRLPSTFLCYTPPKEAPPVAAAPCLHNGYVTFGSFNTRTKLGRETMVLWKRALDAVPSSKLIVKSLTGLRDSNEKDDFFAQLAEVGIARDRVTLLTYSTLLEEHLGLYEHIDICLDTVPYNGTTTTCEALWMGVPVITLAGDRHVSRVSASLLTNAGMSEFVARSAEDFARIATDLAADYGRLGRMRAEMRERLAASPLLDAAAMARELEVAFHGLWHQWCNARLASYDASTSADEGTELSPPSVGIKLNIGGIDVKDGWKILNAQPGPGIDYVGDIRNLERFADDSIEEVYASHVIEHIGQNDVLPTLKGIHRILVPGGKFYISVPDLDVLCHQFLNPRFETLQRYHTMRMMFGGQTDDFDYHQVGLNLEFLADYLREAGFYSVEQVEKFELFEDTSCFAPYGVPISLNLIAVK
jgi:predicted O-linked N-acetylglucosamine transferase (SPINDLY family)/predicted SAM-dependent methyltransferase